MSTTPPDAPSEDGASEETDTVDALRQPLVDDLRATFGDAVIAAEVANGDVWVRIERSAWRAVATYLKEHEGFHYFTFLSGMDWLPSAEAVSRYEKVWGAIEEDAGEADADDEDAAVDTDAGDDDDVPLEMRTGVAGGDTRFQVMCRLYSIERRVGITLKADLDDDAPVVDSLVPVFRGADWHEREAWEMLGFEFTGHPGLRHLYLPGEFEGWPLRKDFPLLAREVKPWPGLVNVEALPASATETAAAGDN